MRENPYQAPAGPGGPLGPQASLLRGLACSVPAAVVGYSVPLLISTTVLRYARGESLINVRADLRDTVVEFTAPCIGCALVFGAAAVLNYAPPARLGMVRALLCVGLSAIVSAFVTGVLTAIFGLGPRTYTSDPWAWLRVAIWVSLIVFYTATHTYIRWRPIQTDHAHRTEPCAHPATNSRTLQSDSASESGLGRSDLADT